jgi:hypothetical protein
MNTEWAHQMRRLLPPEVNEVLDQAQLIVLRKVVTFNRAATETLRAVRPLAAYWWMPAAGLGVGLVAGIASRLAG